MFSIANGLDYIDLQFLGVPRVIATAVIQGSGGVALVDPGPSSALAGLEAGLARAGLALGDVTDILLTHIHLDHAGATGSLVRENPRITTHVHEFGARHLIDPKKLIDSATRLYGDQMERLWGEFLAVPAGSVHTLVGGERIHAAGRVFDVAYTPGHASHHVSFFDASSGVAFVGDTAGVRIGSSSFLMPPTPPPDIDLAAWRRSVELILSWRPETLFLTHFGPSGDPDAHMAKLLDRLDRHANLVRDAMTPERTEAQQREVFERQVRSELQQILGEEDARSYELAVPLDHCFLGLARYWRKREALDAGRSS